MTLDLAELRLLAWHTLPCRYCGEPVGRRCVTTSGARTTPHVDRMDDIAVWMQRQPEVDALTTARDLLTADLRAATLEVTGLNEQAATLTRDLEATTAERDAARDGWNGLADKYDALMAERDAIRNEYAMHMADVHPKPVPAATMLVGAAVGGNADPAPVEKALGHPLDLRRTYWQASQVASAVSTAKADIAAGRTPFLSFKLPASWVDMAAGKHDAWVTGLRDKLAALNAPVWVVFHHEPEGDGNMTDWLAMQRHILPLVTKGQIVPGVCVTGYQQVTGGAIKFSDCWPGSAAKFLAVDLYQRYGTTKNGVKQTTWTDLRGQLAKVNAFAKSVGVPWVNAETGITDAALATKQSAMVDLFAAHRDNDAAALCYFSSSLNSVGTWPLGTGAKLTAFAQAAKS